jgi:uncharacterized protein (DUF58 family)
MRAAAWLAAAAALTFAAGALPSLALFALAVGILVVVVGAAVTVVLAGRMLVLSRSIPEREIDEHEPLRVAFDVRAPAWLPFRLEVRIGRRTWAVLEESHVVELSIGRRGGYLIEPSQLRLCDAMGIFRRKLRVGEPEIVLLLPTPDADALAAPVPGSFAEASEPDGLRPYVPGTPVSRIHWLSLARGRDLHERRLAPPPTGPPLVVVDGAEATDPRAADWVARVAAGRVLGLVREGGCEVLLPGEPGPIAVRDEISWHEVHRRLAVLDGGLPVAVPPVPAALVVRFHDDVPLGPLLPHPPPGVLRLSAGELVLS